MNLGDSIRNNKLRIQDKIAGITSHNKIILQFPE